MIVVIGSAHLVLADGERSAGGLAVDIARAAAAEGSRIEFIARIGDDPAGDDLLVALSRLRIGHVATLRDASRPTRVTVVLDDVADPLEREPTDGPADAGAGHALEREDVGLALRYLTDFGVVVAVHVAPDVIVEVAEAVGWASAHLVVVGRSGDDASAAVPADAIVLLDDSDEGESAVGAAIGRYAAAVERGDDPASAYASILVAGAGASAD
jgi:sugar/nucleoside kinase (ribokinase family)